MKIEELPKVRCGPQRRHRHKRGVLAAPDCPEGRPFKVNINIEGKTYNLGYTATPEEGYELFKRAYKHVYGEDPWDHDRDRLKGRTPIPSPRRQAARHAARQVQAE